MSKSSVVERQAEGLVRDYDEFVAQWSDRIRRIVASNGAFPACDVDDVVQDLIVEFCAKDYLSIYDPEMGSKFSTFIYNFVSRRLLGKRDRYMRKVWREGLSLCKTLDEESGDTFLDGMLSPPDEDHFEFLDMCKSVYRELLTDPVTSPVNDFPRLFSAVVQQIVYGVPEACVLALGEIEANKSGRYGINRKALAWELDVSESGISVMLSRMGNIPAVRSILPA